jgi:hypothetical protein
MSSRTATEDILAEVISPDRGDLPPHVARSLLKWKFTPRAVKRMNTLASRNNRGTITGGEAEELQDDLQVGTLINLVQAKARLSLKTSASDAT